MLTKQKKSTVSFLGKKKKVEDKHLSFLELAMRHAIPGGKENQNLSREIDAILYGAPINNR